MKAMKTINGATLLKAWLLNRFIGVASRGALVKAASDDACMLKNFTERHFMHDPSFNMLFVKGKKIGTRLANSFT
jgi:hypothetical protein